MKRHAITCTILAAVFLSAVFLSAVFLSAVFLSMGAFPLEEEPEKIEAAASTASSY